MSRDGNEAHLISTHPSKSIYVPIFGMTGDENEDGSLGMAWEWGLGSSYPHSPPPISIIFLIFFTFLYFLYFYTFFKKYYYKYYFLKF